MNKTITIIFLLLSLCSFSQNIELIGGINRNNFYDFERNEGHYQSSYKSEYGYTFRIGLEDIKFDKLNLRFTLSYDKYGGKIDVSDGGNGGGYTTIANINKSIISLGVYPLNFRIKNKLDLNFGFEISRLIIDQFEGQYNFWLMNWGSSYEKLNEKYDRFNTRNYFGIIGRIAYDFNINENLILSPQYSYYLGLGSEFEEFPRGTKSMRQYLSVGIQRMF